MCRVFLRRMWVFGYSFSAKRGGDFSEASSEKPLG